MKTLCSIYLVNLQFVLEGVVGDGLEGDIALDDLSVLDGTCTPISRQGECASRNPKAYSAMHWIDPIP